MKAKRSRKAAAAAEKTKPLDRSTGHVCFAGVRGEGKDRGLVRLDEGTDQIGEMDWEYFTGPTGLALYRARVCQKVVELEFSGAAKYGKVPGRENMRAAGGINNFGGSGVQCVVDFCREMRCQIPGETRDKKNKYEARFDDARRAVLIQRYGADLGRAPGSTTGETKMKGKNGMSLAENWAIVFATNEEAAKSGKALTDDQLKAKMYEQFPNKKGKTTIERVSMLRSIYNSGKSIFAKYGAAGTPKRPKSHRYDDGKTPAGVRGQHKPKKDAAPAPAKSAPAKKNPSSDSKKKKVAIKAGKGSKK